MRIKELLEGKNFNDLDFVKTKNDSGEKELDFDLADDLIFYMNNDDDVYRKHVHPVIAKCVNGKKDNMEINPSAFANAVKECYNSYLEEYPIRELPDSLDNKTLKEICEKFHEEVHKHIENGKYK